MSEAVDQLLFTWAQHTTGGRQGFQVVAASEGLRRPTASLTREALRLCRYEPPRGATDPSLAPVSYGWIDRGHERFVFCRSYAGTDASGRPGNFVAHVVAGPAAALPVAQLPARFGSRFWVRAAVENLDPILPMIKLGDIPEGVVPDVEDLDEFVAALLTSGRRKIALPGGPARAAGLMAAVSRRLPDLVAGRSFSTYEPPDTAPWFDIFGCADPPSTALVSGQLAAKPEVVRATQVLLEGGAAAKASLAAAAGDVGVLVSAVQVFDTLSVTTEIAALRPVLKTATGTRALLDLPAGVRLAAKAIVAGEPAIWNGLQDVPPPQSLASVLADEICERSAWLAVPGVLHNASGHSSRFVRDFCAALCVRAEPVHLATLPEDACVAILKQVRPSVPVAEVLLRGVGSRYRAVLEDKTLPPTWRAQVFASALADPAARATLAAFAAKEPELTTEVRSPRLLSAVVTEDSAAGIARVSLRRLAPGQGYELLASHVAGLPPDEQLEFLRACLPPDHRPQWNPVICRALVAVTKTALNTLKPYVLPPPAVVDFLSTAGPVGIILENLSSHPPFWQGVTELRDAPDHQLAAEVALTIMFQQPDEPDWRLVNRLRTCWKDSDEALSAVLRAAARSAPPTRGNAAMYALCYTATLIATGQIRTTRRALPKASNALAVELVQRCGQAAWLTCDAHMAKLAVPVRRWWTDLNKVKSERAFWWRRR